MNLLDDQGRPTETDVPVSLYDSENGNLVEHVVHTMNGKGIPDTLYLDPYCDVMTWSFIRFPR